MARVARSLNSMTPDHVKKEMSTMLLGSVFAMNLFVMLVPENNRNDVSGWLVIVCSAAVVAISAAILYRQRFKGLFGRAYGSMAIGLMLWFVAEMTSVAYRTFVFTAQTATMLSYPMSMTTDVFWLAGYGFFAYFLFQIMFHFINSIKPRILIIVTAATAFIVLILAQSISYFYYDLQAAPTFPRVVASTMLLGNDGISRFIKIEQPILDMILILPSMVILSAFKDGKITATPWLLLSCAVLILAVQDIGNIYFSVLYDIHNHWVWKMFATAGYLCIAASLFWYNRFFIFDSKRALRLWQEGNR
ncbi:MAG TPA: hypothetical protein VJZ68_03540 [Nitrososphaera sp.]|nr:hypothetical protein [Nitrososphaera sp.]